MLKKSKGFQKKTFLVIAQGKLGLETEGKAFLIR